MYQEQLLKMVTPTLGEAILILGGAVVVEDVDVAVAEEEVAAVLLPLEREQHLHSEAVKGFSAILTDLIKTETSWKDAKKVMKKDSRWDSISLEKSERKKLFDDHIDR